MAFDPTDAAFFFVMTESEDDDTLFDVDVYEPYTGRAMMNENHIDWLEPQPFTTVAKGDAGQFLVIQSTANASGEYDMYYLGRRNFGRANGGSGSTVAKRKDWIGDAGAPAQTRCDADLDDPPVAFTATHWHEAF